MWGKRGAALGQGCVADKHGPVGWRGSPGVRTEVEEETEG